MELRHFRYFVHVAEELHFGRAAARLGISQPPLSQQIQLLEQEMGVRLFERSNRRVELTEAGRLFLPEARATLARADRAVDIAQRAQRGEIGELRIGITASAPFTSVIQRAIFAFRQAHPSVHVNLAEVPAGRQVEALAERNLDVGFIRNPQPPALPSAIVAGELFEDRLLVALRADHRLAGGGPIMLAELAGERFVLYPRGHGAGFTNHLAELCRAVGFEPEVSQEARELSTILGLVAAGFGITVLPASLQALQVEKVVYRPLGDEGAVTKMWLIHHRHLLSSAASIFLGVIGNELMRSVLPENGTNRI